MHAQQIMGPAGRSQLVSSDFASAMWSVWAWGQFLERQADAPSDWFNSHFYISILTHRKSTCMCLLILSRFLVALPLLQFFTGSQCTFQSSSKAAAGAARDCCLIKGPRLKLLSGPWVRHWIPNPWGECLWLTFWFLWLTGLKMRSLVSVSTKSPFEMTISVLVVCCGLLKGQGHLSWEWNALCNKDWLREAQ